MKRTGWYRGDQKPLKEREGLFERIYPITRSIYKCHWNGKDFGFGDGRMHGSPSPYQDLPWRGITKESK